MTNFPGPPSWLDAASPTIPSGTSEENNGGNPLLSAAISRLAEKVALSRATAEGQTRGDIPKPSAQSGPLPPVFNELNDRRKILFLQELYKHRLKDQEASQLNTEGAIPNSHSSILMEMSQRTTMLRVIGSERMNAFMAACTAVTHKAAGDLP